MKYLIEGMLGVIAAGSIATNIIFYIRSAHGTLRIDHSNPEKDIYRFDIDEAVLDKISKKKRIILKIDNNADLSQK